MGDRIEFVVLFGSMARGDWGRGSDYDVLVGLRDEAEGRFLDRLQQFDVYSDGWVEPLSYTPSEIEKMVASHNLVLLSALRDGFVLFDRGGWSRLHERYRALLESGRLVSLPRGWRWVPHEQSLPAVRNDITTTMLCSRLRKDVV